MIKNENKNIIAEKIKEKLMENFNDNIKYVKTHEFENTLFHEIFNWINPFKTVLTGIKDLFIEGTEYEMTIVVKFDHENKSLNYGEILRSEYMEEIQSEEFELKLQEFLDKHPETKEVLDKMLS